MFQGKPINPLSNDISEVRQRIMKKFNDSSSGELYILANILEKAGEKIAKLEREVSELKNRRTDE